MQAATIDHVVPETHASRIVLELCLCRRWRLDVSFAIRHSAGVGYENKREVFIPACVLSSLHRV